MLEKYEENFSESEFIKFFMEKEGIKTKDEAMKILGDKVPKESYYQDKIIRALKAKYKNGFCVKVAQGGFSSGGIPDIMFILDGHYFGFEVKRPIRGKLSHLQERIGGWIRKAGGTFAVVRWPEEAVMEVEKWRAENGKAEI